MTTGTVIIEDALRQIGAHSLVAPAPAETLDIGFRKLVQMLHEWLSRNIDLGVSPLEVVGDALNEPPDATNAITSNLAIAMAPMFGGGSIKVTPQLSANAEISRQIVFNLYWNGTVPDKVVSATLPRGQGARIWWTDSTFFGGGATLNDRTGE